MTAPSDEMTPMRRRALLVIAVSVALSAGVWCAGVSLLVAALIGMAGGGAIVFLCSASDAVAAVIDMIAEVVLAGVLLVAALVAAILDAFS